MHWIVSEFPQRALALAQLHKQHLLFCRPLFIRHLHLLDDTTGDFLTEHVHVACVRPVQPIPESPPPLESYQFGEEVDVWVSDMWWEGRIVPGRCTSPSGTRLHTVKSTRACPGRLPDIFWRELRPCPT